VNGPFTYFQSLAMRLAAGLENVPAAALARHADFLKAAQRADGGFAGRQGSSDLYYTSFAVRALAVIGELYGPIAERTAEFLRARLTTRETLIDRMSLVFSAAQLDAAAGIDVLAAAGPWKAELADQLGALRCLDGGFAKGPGGAAGSTYQTFLALLCLQLIDYPWPERHDVVRFVQSQREPEGGFREIRVSKRAGTNPTAAAVGVLRMFDALDQATTAATANFLAAMQNDEGGLLANSRIPLPDLLSTFTGALTLADLQRIDTLDTRAALQFARNMEHPEGGFRAAVWDDVRDVEYTFYGLGCLALLS